MALASWPSAIRPARTSSQASILRDEIITLAPARANSSAMARPMPRDEPVTSATFPERSKSPLTTGPSSDLEEAGRALAAADAHGDDDMLRLAPAPLDQGMA